VSGRALGGGNTPTGDGVVPTIPRSGKVTWAVAWPTFTVVGKVAFRLEAEIDKGFPAAPYVLASNHFSQLDPPLIGTVLRRPIIFLALDELASANRFLAWATSTYGSILLSRNRRPVAAVRAALRALESGEPVGVFPEGRRAVKWGAEPIKRGAAWLAIQAAVPLVPIAIEGTDRVMGIDNRLRRGSVRVAIGPALHPDRAAADPVAELMDRWRRWIDVRLGG
jgi:1-acyl-sn-glycerol-3-phosphate acyltransferase